MLKQSSDDNRINVCRPKGPELDMRYDIFSVLFLFCKKSSLRMQLQICIEINCATQSWIIETCKPLLNARQFMFALHHDPSIRHASCSFFFALCVSLDRGGARTMDDVCWLRFLGKKFQSLMRVGSNSMLTSLTLCVNCERKNCHYCEFSNLAQGTNEHRKKLM